MNGENQWLRGVNIHYKDIHGKSISERRNSSGNQEHLCQIQGTGRDHVADKACVLGGITRDKVKELMRRGSVDHQGTFIFFFFLLGEMGSHCRVCSERMIWCNISYGSVLSTWTDWSKESIQVPRPDKMISHNPGREWECGLQFWMKVETNGSLENLDTEYTREGRKTGSRTFTWPVGRGRSCEPRWEMLWLSSFREKSLEFSPLNI